MIYETIKATGWLTPSPCKIYEIVLTATSAGGADVSIYEGDSATGEKKIVVKAEASTTKVVILFDGYEIKKACYVKLGNNVENLIIGYKNI